MTLLLLLTDRYSSVRIIDSKFQFFAVYAHKPIKKMLITVLLGFQVLLRPIYFNVGNS